jgi:hypothetical protein
MTNQQIAEELLLSNDGANPSTPNSISHTHKRNSK